MRPSLPSWTRCSVGCGPRLLAASHRRHVRQRESVEQPAHLVAHSGPHGQQYALTLVVARPVLMGLAEVADGDRAVDRANDVAEGDGVGFTSEDVAAADAPLRSDDSGALQCQQDLLE